jgi:tetratricopeptide (TPR) repeat protein
LLEKSMRHGLLILLAALLPAIPAGCHFAGWEGISPSLVDSRKLSRQGVTAMERGQQQEAETLLARAVHACPSDTEARRNYAEVLWQRGAQKEAILQMEAAAKTAGEDAAFQVRLAEMYLVAGRVEQATQSSGRALELDPKSATAWAVRGGVMQAAGQPQQALAAYHRALGYDPHDRKILFETAELHRRFEQPDRALQILQTLGDSYTPGEEPQDVLYLTGAAYLALGRYDEAVESMHTAVRRGPPNSDLLCRLAEAELLAGHSREAAAAAGEALALQPQHQPSLDLLQRIEVAEQPRREKILQ